MTDTQYLESLVKVSGFKKKFISDKLGLSYYSFHQKINNKTEFKPSEIKILCDLLSISAIDMEKIFFN